MNDKKRIEELEWQLRLFKEVLDSIHDGVYITDVNQVILWVNKVVEEAEGLKRDDMIGRKESEIYPMLEKGFHENALLTGKPTVEEPLSYYIADGHKSELINSTSLFFENGKVKAAYSIGLFLNYAEKFLIKMMEYRRSLDSGKQIKITTNDTQYTLLDIIGKSDKILNLVETARKIAVNQSSVLITGETGTGKELFAQGIHNASINSKDPFVAINCAAIPETLLESMLFGTVKGSFTGATDKVGLFEQAKNGTLFLDEIDSMSIQLQAKLLRVLQERVVRRIGDNKTQHINCRVISAMNKDPIELLNMKLIRQDLYYRLSVVTLNIPPLRKRKEDIFGLAEFFLSQFNKKFKKYVKKLDDTVESVFYQYDWPGNIREFRHVIEYAMNMVKKSGENIQFEYLPQFLQKQYKDMKKKQTYFLQSGDTLKDILKKVEKQTIEEALQKNAGNITKAAKELGIFREALHYRINKLKIK
jgi:arginine utilization regulatory protein